MESTFDTITFEHKNKNNLMVYVAAEKNYYF